MNFEILSLVCHQYKEKKLYGQNFVFCCQDININNNNNNNNNLVFWPCHSVVPYKM